MRKQDVIAFFDRLAPQWDADMIRHDDIIATILDNAAVEAGTCHRHAEVHPRRR